MSEEYETRMSEFANLAVREPPPHSTLEPRYVRPIRDNIYIQRIRPAQSAGGIIFPTSFKFGKSGFSAKAKMDAIPDVFPAHVLALGPEVRELSVGDEIMVYTYAEGDGSKLYTGETTGERERLFIRPDDVVCAVDR
jgi:co-chaperonin GroES (HSP10)